MQIDQQKEDSLINAANELKKYTVIKIKWGLLCIVFACLTTQALCLLDIDSALPPLVRLSILLLGFACTVTAFYLAFEEGTILSDASLMVLADLANQFDIKELSVKIKEKGQLSVEDVKAFLRRAHEDSEIKAMKAAPGAQKMINAIINPTDGSYR